MSVQSSLHIKSLHTPFRVHQAVRPDSTLSCRGKKYNYELINNYLSQFLTKWGRGNLKRTNLEEKKIPICLEERNGQDRPTNREGQPIHTLHRVPSHKYCPFIWLSDSSKHGIGGRQTNPQPPAGKSRQLRPPTQMWMKNYLFLS